MLGVHLLLVQPEVLPAGNHVGSVDGLAACAF